MILIFALIAVLGMGLLVYLADQRPYRIDREQPEWDLTNRRLKR